MFVTRYLILMEFEPKGIILKVQIGCVEKLKLNFANM